MQQISNFN